MANPVVPSISAVVCTRNRGSRVASTVESILACDHPSFELVVIDQSTDDDSRDALAEFAGDARLRYVRSDSIGLGRARNEGLSTAHAELIAFTDDDVTVPTNWLAVMEDVFAQNPRVTVAFCNVVAAAHDATAGFVPVYQRRGSAEITTLRGKCRARGIGAGLAVRRLAMIEIGGFDPQLGAGGRFSSCEDGDAAVRALLAGHSVFETDATEVVHDGFRTWEEGRQLTERDWYGIGAAYSKPIRVGQVRGLVVVLYEGIWRALLHPLAQVFRLRRPTGLKRGIALLERVRGRPAHASRPPDAGVRRTVVIGIDQVNKRRIRRPHRPATCEAAITRSLPRLRHRLN